MERQGKQVIRIENTVNAPVKKVWEYWTKPEHIVKWNHASDDWHSPWSKNDLREGGSFSARMEAKDGSMGFDFGGTYDAVREHQYIEYTIGDGRKVKIDFTPQNNSTQVVESFEAEDTNSLEMQRGGWQAILDNFKKYTENN
jgi:uncharacterized protein YndB with AHSA1/START domain